MPPETEQCLKSQSAMIVGLARNCAGSLKETLKRLDRFRATFAFTRYVIITNDSVDETSLCLHEWARGRSDIEIIVADGLVENVPLRTARLAVARNMLLQRLQYEHRKGERFDYLLMLDLDGPNANLLDEPYFTEVITDAPREWGALFANQRTTYYDIWALRHPTWCPKDCHQEVAEAKKYFFWPIRRYMARKAYRRYVKNRQIHIDSSTNPIPVNSAFGGFGIYRTKYLASAYYVGLTAEGKEVCEHVHFHSMIANNGAKLYILPELLNDSGR